MNINRIQLGDAVKVSTGHPIRGSVKPVDLSDANANWNAKIVQMKNVSPESGIDIRGLQRINTKLSPKTNYVSEGDILFVGRGTRFFAVEVKERLDQTIAAPYFQILRPINPELSPSYLAWFLNHNKAQKFFHREAKGSAITYVSKSILEKLTLEIPTRRTQEKILAISECLENELSILSHLAEKRTLLINTMIENKIFQQE